MCVWILAFLQGSTALSSIALLQTFPGYPGMRLDQGFPAAGLPSQAGHSCSPAGYD